MNIEHLIRTIKTKGASLRPPIELEGLAPMRFDCTLATRGSGPKEIKMIPGRCPDSLRQFWQIVERARLFEDQTYGQWGLELISPQEALKETHRMVQMRPNDAIEGDLVIGRFLGDSDLLVIRCNPTSDDFGHVLVAFPLDSRTEWDTVGTTFEDFLGRYVQAAGDKYWERR